MARSADSAVRIRTAGPDDACALAALLAGGALSVTEDVGDLAPYRDALGEIATTPGAEVLVAEVDGVVVGMCQLVMFRHLQARGGRCAELESVFVDAGQRGGGIGARLVAAAVELARGAGCYRVQLTSNVARTDAHRFWVRNGFDQSHLGFKQYLARP